MMMRSLIALIVLCVSATAHAQGPVALPVNQPMIRSEAPVLYMPRVTWQPYQLQSSVYHPREYRTPLRNLLFGRGYMQNIYAPVQPQQLQVGQ